MMVAGRVNSLEVLHSDVRDAASGNRRVRRSAAQPPRMVQYFGSTSKKLRIKDNLALYLKAPQNATSLSVGPHSEGDADVCFKMHNYDAHPAPPGGGQVVILQTHDGRHVTVTQDSLTFQTPPASENTQLINSPDERFFHKYRAPGDESVFLKHLQSGKFLSATTSGVSLLTTNDTPRSIFFQEFQCNHT